MRDMRFAAVFFLAFCASLSISRAQVPVYEVTPVESSIKFGVESSVPIDGTFDKWDASMTFARIVGMFPAPICDETDIANRRRVCEGVSLFPAL